MLRAPLSLPTRPAAADLTQAAILKKARRTELLNQQSVNFLQADLGFLVLDQPEAQKVIRSESARTGL
jgi:hypothetical protein